MDCFLPVQNMYWLDPVETVTKLQIPQELINLLTNQAAISFSVRSLLHAANCSVDSYQERH
jgi:hypothetical protein